MTEVNYENASYYDGGTGLDKDLVFNTLFSNKNGFNESVMEEINAIEEAVSLPDEVEVTEVHVREDSNTNVDFVVSIRDITVGTQVSRGNAPKMVLRSDEYNTYRVGIEAMG